MKDAVVAILRDGEKVLVIRRGPGASRSGYWAPPSGRVEPRESQAETVVREMREELALEVAPVAKIWECPTDDGRYRLHWWHANVVGGELQVDGSEVVEALWVTPDEFARMRPTFDGDREFFERILPSVPTEAL